MNNWTQKLQEKWREIPGACHTGRMFSSDLLKKSDTELVKIYDSTVMNDKPVRGGYEKPLYELYKNKKVLDIGSGFGISSIQFALKGADVTFLDLVQDNLNVLKRICEHKNIKANYFCMTSLDDLNKLKDEEYDYFFAQGSLMNAPYGFMKKEMALLVPKLKKHGILHTLSYPKERWVANKSPSFEQWGKMTDGERTPYCEWYDGNKFIELLKPAKFKIIKEYNFGRSTSPQPFNWIELQKL